MRRKILYIISASLLLCLIPFNSEARKQKKAVSDSLSVKAVPDSIAKERQESGIESLIVALILAEAEILAR